MSAPRSSGRVDDIHEARRLTSVAMVQARVGQRLAAARASRSRQERNLRAGRLDIDRHNGPDYRAAQDVLPLKPCWQKSKARMKPNGEAPTRKEMPAPLEHRNSKQGKGEQAERKDGSLLRGWSRERRINLTGSGMPEAHNRGEGRAYGGILAPESIMIMWED